MLFENEEKKMYLPVEVVDFLNIYSNVTFSSDFFKFAKEKEIIITFYDKFGRYSGVFLPPYLNRSSKTLISQVSIFLNEEKRLSIAKLITEASCHNIRSNVRYYNKYLKDGRLYKSLKEFDEFILKIEKCESLENLFLIEAQGKEEYFSRFNIFLKDDSFDFENRNRRPPKDPINALISFGNTILYQIIAREIYKTGLDIRISFMHSPNKRNESLNLDIADIFKPIIIDRVIFTMINKKII
ncbi:MAG: CRISPR-associated endonuclease Cas1, partial [Oscillospiraceae bacterium]|nr:CRISPR-associated endonuclease Cas1 [Oscillospiraceae bacterium]